jgi:hypothetical protein
MARAEKNGEKYQCTACSYGHADAGKSRQAVYKHWNLEHVEEPNEIPVNEQEAYLQPETDLEVDDWGSISWLNPDEEEDVIPHTIPSPIRRLSEAREGSQLMAAHRTMEKSLLRWGFLGLDRLVTWWGRGVMSKPDWELKRSQQDYDVLQDSTISLMDAYGIRVPASPWMVWGTIVGSAYAPPMIHIQKNADPNRKRRGLKLKLPGLGFFKRKKNRRVEVEDVDA